MYFNKDTYSLYYEKHGNKDKTILILPGWGDTRKTFKMMIEYLQMNYTIYIIDYPGFGNSIFPEHDLTIYDYTNMIKDFMEEEKIVNPIKYRKDKGIKRKLYLYYRDLNYIKKYKKYKY